MESIFCNNIVTIIGICGSLIGTILGFTLNQFLRIGRIKIFQNKVNFSIFSSGYPIKKRIDNGLEKDSISIEMQIDIFNTSPLSPKILRDIKLLVIGTDNRTSYYDIKYINKSSEIPEDFSILNLNPKELQHFNLTSSIDNNKKSLRQGKWYFSYKGNRNKERKIKLKNNRL